MHARSDRGVFNKTFTASRTSTSTPDGSFAIYTFYTSTRITYVQPPAQAAAPDDAKLGCSSRTYPAVICPLSMSQTITVLSNDREHV